MRENTALKTSNPGSKQNEKIELMRCPRGGDSCHSHLSEINKSFVRSNDYQHIKEYQLSIESLRSAFKKTYELKESTCSQCARFFRSTIINSLEKMHDDLHSMSNSFFRGKRYQGSYAMAKDVLQDLKNKDQ